MMFLPFRKNASQNTKEWLAGFRDAESFVWKQVAHSCYLA
jgi:hypothetical protein